MSNTLEVYDLSLDGYTFISRYIRSLWFVTWGAQSPEHFLLLSLKWGCLDQFFVRYRAVSSEIVMIKFFYWAIIFIFLISKAFVCHLMHFDKVYFLCKIQEYYCSLGKFCHSKFRWNSPQECHLWGKNQFFKMWFYSSTKNPPQANQVSNRGAKLNVLNLL